MADQNQKDFVLPNEQKTGAAPGAATGQTAPPAEPYQGRQPISSKELLVGSGIVLLGAFLFFFARGLLTENLIRRRKSPAAANRAGWALFFFLTFTTALLVFGFLGGLWGNLLFVVPMGIFIAVSLVFFISSAIAR